MSSIHRDLVSIPRSNCGERCVRSRRDGGERAARTDLGWNGEMRADSVAARAYAAVRLELTKLAIKRAGLDKTATAFHKVSPGIFPEVQFWWTLPQLLRANDETLLRGATWDELLREAMAPSPRASPRRLGDLAYAKTEARAVGGVPDYANDLDKDLRHDLRRQ